MTRRRWRADLTIISLTSLPFSQSCKLFPNSSVSISLECICMQASLYETMSRNSWLGNSGGGGNEFYMMMMFDNDPSGEGETSSSDAEKRWMLVVVVVVVVLTKVCWWCRTHSSVLRMHVTLISKSLISKRGKDEILLVLMIMWCFFWRRWWSLQSSILPISWG